MPFDQRSIALEQQLRQLERGGLVTAARQLLPVVQHHERLTRRNVIAGRKPDLDDLAAAFRREFHAPDRLYGADGI